MSWLNSKRILCLRINTSELTVLNPASPIKSDRHWTASSSSQRLVYREGLPMAHGSRSKIHYLQAFDAEHQWRLRWALMGK